MSGHTPNRGNSQASLTPQQQENRRIYEERMKTYDGTGPSPAGGGGILATGNFLCLAAF
jgi:hypothetical protein